METLFEAIRGSGACRKTARALPYTLLIWSLLLFATPSAYAHGTVSHVPGTDDFGVIVGQYQFLLEGNKHEVTPGQKDRLVIRVYDMKSGQMVRGARLLLAPKVPQAFDKLPVRDSKPLPPITGMGHGEEGHGVFNGPPPGSPFTWTPDGDVDLSRFLPATEGKDPGHYHLDFVPMTTGPYLLQLAMLMPGQNGRTETIITQLPFEVTAPSGANVRMWFSLTAILLAFVLALYAFRVQANRSGPLTDYFNLLELPWLSRLMRASLWKIAVQGIMLLIFAAVVVLGFVDAQESSRNLSTILLWTIWWAGIIFTFVLMGRAWCLICPVGAVSEWTNQLTGSQRRLGRRYRNLWTATGLFLLLTWGDGYWGIVGSPARTAMIFLLFGVLAVTIGALFARRTFCRYVCPIGGVIGLYSMFAPVELRARSLSLCQADPTKACYVGSEAGKGCPMFEFPQRMDANTYCIYCGDCLNTCLQENISLKFRRFGKDLWSASRRTLDEAFLAVAMIAVSGTAAGHMVGAWHGWMDALAAYLPVDALGITSHATVEKLTYSLVFWAAAILLPLMVYLASLWTWHLLGKPEKAGPGALFIQFAYAFIPLGLAMHLAHNMQHFFREGPLVIPVLLKTLNQFTPWYFGTPN
ncbi:MAG TPA: 4Fe-4S binding protein, partial [Terriglobales bacterium]|nr:4Fe-4S binding protein [Terriglobales bacterium]